MAIKKYKPITPSLRHMTVLKSDEITKHEPEKSLLATLKKNAGRNSQGSITVRHRGGGAKRKYRIIDFKRDKDQIPAKVAGIEYDPNRSANIALLHYVDGEKRYILAPNGLKVGTLLLGYFKKCASNVFKSTDLPLPLGPQIIVCPTSPT